MRQRVRASLSRLWRVQRAIFRSERRGWEWDKACQSGGMCSNRYLLNDVPGPEGITHEGALVALETKRTGHFGRSRRLFLPTWRVENRLRCAGSREARMGCAHGSAHIL